MNWRHEEVQIKRGELLAIWEAAVQGYNAELKFKTLRRKGERESERAMRLGEVSTVLEKFRADVRPPDVAAPQPIE